MADVTNDLLFAIVKSPRNDLRMLKESHRETRRELIAVSGQIMSIGIEHSPGLHKMAEPPQRPFEPCS